MATMPAFREGPGDEARAFPILYYDDHNLFPSLLPFIEGRLPLDGVPIKNPFSPHGAVYCNTLRLIFIHRDALSDTAAPPKSAVSGSATVLVGSAGAAKLSGTATAGTSSGSSAAGIATSHASTAASTQSASSAASAPGASAETGVLGLNNQPPGRHSRSGTASTVVAAHSVPIKPFVYLQVLQFESIEEYKTHHRRVLRAWVDSLTEQHEEWLVLYVTPFSESETQTRSFKKILDKLRSDLNPPGSRSRERFLRVPTDPSGQYCHAPVFHDLWNAFILRLKEALAAAVEGRYVQLEDEVQRQTHAAEPRFCAVFTAKEDLASLHALCNRPEEALAVLDSLDLLRNSSGGRGLYDLQATGSDALPWQNFFHTFGFASPDSEVPVLFNQKRLSRLQAALREDTISYVDFRQYLFARQADLLLRLNRCTLPSLQHSQRFASIMIYAACMHASSLGWECPVVYDVHPACENAAAVEELGARAVQLVSSVYKELRQKNISTGGHTWALLAALNLAGYIVAQSAVLSERSDAGRELPETTPRSFAVDDGSPRSSSRQQEFGAPTSTTGGASPFASQYPLLPLKYPTLASAARTLHRFTPLQFSFSPTRRGHASHRARMPPVSFLQGENLTVPPSAAADSAGEPAESGGVQDSHVAAKDGARGSSAAASNAAAAAAAVPAPAARCAAVLYGYAAQQLQRLIRWRERCHWHTPLGVIPVSDGEVSRKQHAGICNAITLSSSAVESEAADAPSDDRFETTDDKATSAGPGNVSASGQRDGAEKKSAEGGEVDDEPFFHQADMERLDGLLMIVSRRNLIEELQTAAAVEDMLARIFVLAGQQYMNGGYYRHAALLQFRLAAANFKRGFLEECRGSLGRLLPLFLKEPWTELWLECQQLLCEADHRLGDREAELRSTYVLSNVKAQYHSKKFHVRAGLMHGVRKADGGTSPSVDDAADMLPSDLTMKAADSVGAVDAGSASGGSFAPAAKRYSVAGSREADRKDGFPVHPEVFLQRFIALARAQRADRCGKQCVHGAAVAEEERDRQRPSASTEDGVTSSSAAKSIVTAKAGKDSVFSAEKISFWSEMQGTKKRSGTPIGVLNAPANEEAQMSPSTPSCTCLADSQFFEISSTSAELPLHLGSSPNLYCWAALKAWWPSNSRLGEGVCRGCMQPALALASASAQTPGVDPSNALPLCYGGGSVEGTPYTFTSVTPTGASTTMSFLSNTVCAVSGDLSVTAAPGRSTAALPTRRHVLSSWLPSGALRDGGSALSCGGGFHSGIPLATPAAVRRGSRSGAEIGHELPHVSPGEGAVKGDFLFYMPRFPGATSYAASVLRSPASESAFLRNFLRVKGSVDHDLLEHAVVRQLADLLPLYQLPFHPELGPRAYFFAYVATLQRLKPKSVAQVLGQHQRLYARRRNVLQQDNARNENTQRQLAGDAEEQTLHSELSTVAAAAEPGDEGDEQPPSRPRSAIRAASEGTQKTRSRGSKKKSASFVETDADFSAEAATTSVGEEQTAVHRSVSGLSSGLREFRWRRSKTLTHVEGSGTSKEKADLKGKQGTGSVPQQGSQESEQRSSARTTKGAGRVSLLLSRRRRSTTTCMARTSATGPAAPTSAVVTEAGDGGIAVSKATSTVAELVPQMSLQSAETAAAPAGAHRLKENMEGNVAGNSTVAEGGRGTQTRLPEQFRTRAQQVRAPPGERSTPRAKIAADSGDEPSPIEQAAEPHEAWVSQAGDDVRDTATTVNPLPQHMYPRRRPLGAESPTAVSGGGATRSRALSVLEMSSMQNLLPSLSVSLGQHIELQLYIHSSLAGTLPADYIAVRLSQLPGNRQDDQFAPAGAAGGLRIASRLRHAIYKDAAVAAAGESLGDGAIHMLASGSSPGGDKAGLFERQRRGATASVWLMARSGHCGSCLGTDSSIALDGKKDKVRGEKEDLPCQKLILRPGVNRLSLLWSSRIEGVFVLEQICIGIGGASLVQWAGDLPLPDMMGSVAQMMQQVLLTASLLQHRWYQGLSATASQLPSAVTPAGADAGVGKAVLEKNRDTRNVRRPSLSATVTHNTSVKLSEERKARRGEGIAPDTGSTDAGSLMTGARIGCPEKSGEQAASLSTPASHAQSNATSSAINADARAAQKENASGTNGRECAPETQSLQLFKESENPLFQPNDYGNVVSATAFDERQDPPIWLMQQLALGCSPLAATLLQPVAPLERMLRPLIFEIRSPSTAVQIHVQPASPSDTFLFLDATNFFTIRIDVMPGLFSGPTASRLRVLQCLLPVVCPDEQQEGIAYHSPELQMQDALLLDGGGVPYLAGGDDDLESCHESTSGESRRGAHAHSRFQRQRASMSYQSRSAHHESSGASPSVNAAVASPGLSLGSPGTGDGGTWRRYFRRSGGGTSRAAQTHSCQKYGSIGVAADDDGLATHNSLLKCSSSSTHEMEEGALFGKRRYRRNDSLAQIDKETLASPWTPTTPGFDYLGPVSDERQLFEAAAVQLQFQWHHALVHRLDGVPVRRKLRQQGSPSQPTDNAIPTAATGGTAASVRDHRRQQGEEHCIQANQHRRPSASETRLYKRRSGSETVAAAEQPAKERSEHSTDGVLPASGCDSNPSSALCGMPSSSSYHPTRCMDFLPNEETPLKRRNCKFLRLCADEEDGDVLALVPEPEKSDVCGRNPCGRFYRAHSATPAVPTVTPGQTMGGACWLELPPFQTSCEIVLPVIPVRVDEGSSMKLYSAAGADAGTCDDTTPTGERALFAHQSPGMWRPASADGLTPQDTLDGLRDLDSQNFSGSSGSSAWRSHPGGRAWISMCQAGSSSTIIEERQLQQANRLQTREEEVIPPFCPQRSSSFGNDYAVRVRPSVSRPMTMLQAGGSDEQQQRWIAAQYAEDMTLPRTFSFRRRRTAFVVPPCGSSPQSVGGQEDHLRLLDRGPSAVGRASPGFLDDADPPLNSPAARAAQQVSMAALLKRQQQVQEERRLGHLQQEQPRRAHQQPAQLHRRLSSAYSYACRPAPLEYHVHVVTTLQFYTQTGIPPAAAAEECLATSGATQAAAQVSAGMVDPWPASLNFPGGVRGGRCFSPGLQGQAPPAVHTNDLGIIVPTVYPRRTVIGRHSTLEQAVHEEFGSVRKDASGTVGTSTHALRAYEPCATQPTADADGSKPSTGESKGALIADNRLGSEPGTWPNTDLDQAAPSHGRCPSPTHTARAEGGPREGTSYTLQGDDPGKSDRFSWRRFKTEEAHEEDWGAVDDVDEEDFEYLEVCAEETMCARHKQQKELAKLLMRGSKGRLHHQEIHADKTMVNATGYATDKTEGRTPFKSTAETAGSLGGLREGSRRDAYQERSTCAETTSWHAFAAQPVTVIRASTSRVHRLSARLALQHSQRLLHVNRSVLLQQVVLSSCCSPAEPVIVESASIERLPSVRSTNEELLLSSDDNTSGQDETENRADQGNETGELKDQSFRQNTQTSRDEHIRKRGRKFDKQERERRTTVTIGKHRRHRRERRGPTHPQTEISLVAPPPANGFMQESFFQAVPQEADAVRLDSLLFGEKVTALLVQLQHRRSHSRRLCLNAAAHREREEKQRGILRFRDVTGQRGASGDSSSDIDDNASRRLRAAFEPKLEAFVLSIRYRFLQRTHGKCVKGRWSAGIPAATVSPPGGGDQEISNDETTTQATETTDPEDEGNAQELLVYKIPLVFPVQQFPFEVRFKAQRTGRVSSPLVISLVFANWSDVQLDVRHVVSLEFDDEGGPGMRTAAKFFSLSPLLSSASAFVSGLQQQCSRLYSAAGLLRPLDRINDGARTFADWRSSTARRGTAVTMEDPGKGCSGKKDSGRSSRLGECHDWLMVGSKCKTTTVAARSRRLVQFQLVPLRAGSLPLPTIRVRIRPSKEVDRRRLLKLSYMWQSAAAEGSALGIGGGGGVPASPFSTAERDKTDNSVLFPLENFSSCRQNPPDYENDGEIDTDWWLPLPYGESITAAGRPVIWRLRDVKECKHARVQGNSGSTTLPISTGVGYIMCTLCPVKARCQTFYHGRRVQGHCREKLLFVYTKGGDCQQSLCRR